MNEAASCPKCGTVMNHQADKLTYPTSLEEAAAMMPEFEGIILNVFACPRCGWIESRRAGPLSPPSPSDS